MTRPTFKRQVFAPAPFTVAIGADPHKRDNARPEHWDRARQLIAERNCVATFILGDLNRDDVLDWGIYPVPGNWDTKQPPNSTSPIDPDPFGDLRSFYPQQFGPRDWYSLDIEGRLRVLVCQNNSPNILDGSDTYGNCNPNSPFDHSGWNDPLSEQRLWMNQMVSEWEGEHVLLCTHRPAWAPYTHDIRPLHPNKEAWAIPVWQSVGKTFVAAGGDIHVGSHCRVHAFGCEFDSLTACGGYANRPVVDGIVPYEWASGITYPNTFKVHVHFVTYYATWAALQTVEISDVDPLGRVVHEATIIPVTGGQE